jgi:hypothetical protein
MLSDTHIMISDYLILSADNIRLYDKTMLSFDSMLSDNMFSVDNML